MRTIKVYTGPVGVERYAAMLAPFYEDISVGTEHLYIPTGHSVEHVEQSFRTLGISGFKANDFRILNCGK